MTWENGKIYKDDIGKEIRLDTRIDISNYDTVRIMVRTPTGDTEWDCTAASGDTVYNETEGLSILRYITQAIDFVVPGTYIIIAYVKFSVTSIHYGEPAKFVVYDRFEPD